MSTRAGYLLRESTEGTFAKRWKLETQKKEEAAAAAPKAAAVSEGTSSRPLGEKQGAKPPASPQTAAKAAPKAKPLQPKADAAPAPGAASGNKVQTTSSTAATKVKATPSKPSEATKDKNGKSLKKQAMSAMVIGAGCYASVGLVHSRSLKGIRRAVKLLKQNNNMSRAAMLLEINCMTALDHPNIVRVFEIFDESKYLYVVMEHLEGPTLHDWVKMKDQASEEHASIVTRQVLLAVLCMQEMHISHNDLSVRNTMFTYKVESAPIERNTVKVIDFGAATMITDSSTSKGDVWRTGCLMNFLLAGGDPNDVASKGRGLSAKRKDVWKNEKVKIGDVMMHASIWLDISEDAKSVASMLLTKAKDKYPIRKILGQRWLRQAPVPICEEATKILQTLAERLRFFEEANELKRVSLIMMVDLLSEEELRPLREAFSRLDSNRDGLLTPDEVQFSLTVMQLEVPADLRGFMLDLDPDGVGAMDITTFMALAIGKEALTEARAMHIFDTLDRSGKGFLTAEDIKKTLFDIKESYVEEMMTEVATGENESITFKDFMSMLRWRGDEEKWSGFGVIRAVARFRIAKRKLSLMPDILQNAVTNTESVAEEDEVDDWNNMEAKKSDLTPKSQISYPMGPGWRMFLPGVKPPDLQCVESLTPPVADWPDIFEKTLSPGAALTHPDAKPVVVKAAAPKTTAPAPAAAQPKLAAKAAPAVAAAYSAKPRSASKETGAPAVRLSNRKSSKESMAQQPLTPMTATNSLRAPRNSSRESPEVREARNSSKEASAKDASASPQETGKENQPKASPTPKSKGKVAPARAPLPALEESWRTLNREMKKVAIQISGRRFSNASSRSSRSGSDGRSVDNSLSSQGSRFIEQQDSYMDISSSEEESSEDDTPILRDRWACTKCGALNYRFMNTCRNCQVGQKPQKA
eukprot:TRINITY_DN91244_c0_g1_i1.p1 TRINITY_DN91244_c0_g1~~TRINITY_DN91244_c0_g1_i1.p1  ORF type:complete len:924 (-),score=274.32 TRINITY_DN91244_c0_g1_i1:100-2871(-)